MAELKTPYKISLDFYIRKIITVNAKQLDSDSRIINITCTENGKKFFINSFTTSAFVRYKKSDGFAVLNQVNILADGTVNLELSQQMLAVEGRHLVDIMLINNSELELYMQNITAEDDGEGNVTIVEYAVKQPTINISDLTVEEILEGISKNGISVLSTMSFYINTEGVTIDDSEIESSYEYNALIDGLGKMVAVDERLVQIESNANEAIQKCNIATENANIASENVNQAIINSNEATKRANVASENAGQATKDAQTATENANQATESAKIATQNANAATTNANNAAQETLDVLYNGGMVLKTDIIHNLETEDENKVPDATQVKILNKRLLDLQTQLDTEVKYNKANAITTEYTGETICTTDSANAPLQDMNVFGKTWQDINQLIKGYNGKNTTEGVTFTGTDGGNILINGTATVDLYITIFNADLISGDTYTLSCNEQLAIDVFTPSIGESFKCDVGSGKLTFIPSLTGRYIISITNSSGTTFNNVLANIMLVEGSTAFHWRPYTNGSVSGFPKEAHSCGESGSIKYTLTDNTEENVQTLVLQTPNGLHGLPVLNGGNWIDTTGQRYLSDVIRLTRKKKEQWIGVIDSYNNEDITTVFMSTTGKLSEGAKVFYALDEPIETDLTEEEIAQYKALLMNYSYNALTNDARAYTEIKQVCDTKLYITNLERKHENDIQELKTAIIALGGVV